jgi:membrane protease subunit HflC
VTARFLNLLALGILAALLLLNCLSVVPEGSVGLRQRLGTPDPASLPPGLYFRLPLLDRIQLVDMRTRISDTGSAEYLDAGNQGMRLEAWVSWRVTDLPRYAAGAGAEPERAVALLTPMVEAALRRALARASWAQHRHGLPASRLAEIVAASSAAARREIGVEILAVGVRRVAFTAPVQEVVLERLRIERESEAARLRNDAAVQADIISAAAAREGDVLLTQARQQAAARTALGEAEAAAIIATARRQDPAFFRFREGLQRWRQGFGKPGDVLVLAPGSPLRAYLKPPTTEPPAVVTPGKK